MCTKLSNDLKNSLTHRHTDTKTHRRGARRCHFSEPAAAYTKQCQRGGAPRRDRILYNACLKTDGAITANQRYVCLMSWCPSRLLLISSTLKLNEFSINMHLF